MSAYETAAVTELMNRIRAHEIGHIRLHSEVARIQTGSANIAGDADAAIAWEEKWKQDTLALAGTAGPDIGIAQNTYEGVVGHGLSQSKVGGLDTKVQVCNPKAAILGDVPVGEIAQEYFARLELGKENADDDDLVVTPPMTWAVEEGSLPPGILLRSYTDSGALAGIPTERGTYTFTVRGTDANGLTATRVISLTVAGTTVIALERQRYSVTALIGLTDGRPQQDRRKACQGVYASMDSYEANESAGENFQTKTSAEDNNACGHPSATPVAAPGVPYSFDHSTQASATVGGCQKSGAGQLAASIGEIPDGLGFEIQASELVSAPKEPSSGCGHITNHHAHSGVTYVFAITGGTADFQWQITECTEQNWPSGFSRRITESLSLYQKTTPTLTQVIYRDCGVTGPTDLATVVLEPGVYELKISTAFGLGANNESVRAEEGATASMRATVKIAPTPERPS